MPRRTSNASDTAFSCVVSPQGFLRRGFLHSCECRLLVHISSYNTTPILSVDLVICLCIITIIVCAVIVHYYKMDTGALQQSMREYNV